MANWPFTWFNLADNALGQLAAPIDNAVTEFSLQSGQGIKFPASDFIVNIESERLHVASRATDVCSGVTRGYDNSTPAAHLANTYAHVSPSRALFQRIYDNLIGHTHPRADIPDFTHNHAQGDVTNLVTDLAAKAAASHSHSPSEVTGTAVITSDSRLSDARAPITHNVLTAHNGFPGGTSTFLRADGAFAAPPGGGSDPWTYLRLASDFLTSSATAVDVTGLSFAPVATTRYQIEGMFLVRTATATVGPRPGCAWPTGMTDGVAMIDLTSAAAARVLVNGNINAAVLSSVGGLPNTTQSWPAALYATLIAGAAPGSTFRVQLASETAGTAVRMMAGSWIRYRTIP